MSAQDNRSVRQIEAEIEGTRERLAATIDQLVYRTKPATIANRQKEAAMVKYREFAYTPEGDLRTERLAAVGAVIVGLIAIRIIRQVRA